MQIPPSCPGPSAIHRTMDPLIYQGTPLNNRKKIASKPAPVLQEQGGKSGIRVRIDVFSNFSQSFSDQKRKLEKMVYYHCSIIRTLSPLSYVKIFINIFLFL